MIFEPCLLGHDYYRNRIVCVALHRHLHHLQATTIPENPAEVSSSDKVVTKPRTRTQSTKCWGMRLSTLLQSRVCSMKTVPGAPDGKSLSLSLSDSFFLHFLLCILFCWIFPFITGLSHPFFGRGFPLYILLLSRFGPDNSFRSQDAGRFPQDINIGGIPSSRSI